MKQINVGATRSGKTETFLRTLMMQYNLTYEQAKKLFKQWFYTKGRYF